MNENETTTRSAPEKIDIMSFLDDMLNRLRSFWWVILLLTAGLGALNYFRTTTYYTASYTAEATVSVEIMNGGTYSNENTADQMGKVFPYILTSGALSEVVAADLNMSYVPGSISAKAISGTNLLTISVSGSNPENVYKVLQSVLKNYPEVAQYVVGQSRITVIDDSGIPTDTGKTRVVRGSVRTGLIIGFALGVVLLVIYTLMTRTVRSEKDLTKILNTNFLGSLPVVRRRRGVSRGAEINILSDEDMGGYTEAIRLIRTRLEREMGSASILMVTSSIPGEGKSTVAANLAISFAETGKRVILVDCDLRNPTSKKIFGITDVYPGLAAVLRGKSTLKETLAPVTAPNGLRTSLWLLPGSEDISNTMEMMDSKAMDQLLTKLRKSADLVILDTPPSAMLADAMILTRHADGIAYVVSNDFAKRRVIYKGMAELQDSGVRIYGCILNGVTSHSRRSGYGYGYYGYQASHYSAAAENTED